MSTIKESLDRSRDYIVGATTRLALIVEAVEKLKIGEVELDGCSATNEYATVPQLLVMFFNEQSAAEFAKRLLPQVKRFETGFDEKMNLVLLTTTYDGIQIVLQYSTRT